MKVAFISPNMNMCGEPVAAMRWNKAFNRYGIESSHFAFSNSGKYNLSTRSDVGAKLLRPGAKFFDESVATLSEFDVIVVYGAGSFDSVDVYPSWMSVLDATDKPRLVSVASVESIFSTYKWWWALICHPRTVGIYFLRDSIREWCYETYPSIFLRHPYHILKHPVFLEEIQSDKHRSYDGKRFVSTSRFSMSKKPDVIVDSFEEANIENSTLEIWGQSQGRAMFYFKNKVRESERKLKEYYKGTYTLDDLFGIYSNADFMIDLTMFPKEPRGGIQNTSIECLLHNVIPITSRKFKAYDTPAPTILDPSSVSQVKEALIQSSNMRPDSRKFALRKGHDYLKEVHNPEMQVEGFSTYISRII